MARSAPAFNSFTAGEISPKFEGRTNIDKYSEGLADLTNMIVLPSGGVTRRPGTEFAGEVGYNVSGDNTRASRLIPFQFKTSDTYILEFTGANKMRVYRNGLQVLEAAIACFNVTTASQTVFSTSSAHGYSDGDEVYMQDLNSGLGLTSKNYIVDNSTSTTFELVDLFGNGIDTSSFSGSITPSQITFSRVYELAQPFDYTYYDNIKYVQSADTMYFVHPSVPAYKLIRRDHDDWEFEQLIFAGGFSNTKYIENITNANPGVLTVTGHGYSDGDEIALSSIQGMTELSGNYYIVANSTTDTFTLQKKGYSVDVDTTSFGTFEDGGGETADITNATTANPCVITSNNHPFFDDDVIYIKNVTGMTQLNDKYYIVASATTNTFALKDMSGNDVNASGYSSYSSGGTAELALSKVQNVNLMSTSLTGTDNYPSTVSFFEQRLVFGGSNNNPQTLWFSKNADYQNFETGTADDDALIYTIASNQVNAIRYLSATRVLTVGTSGGEYVLTSANDGPITPTSTLIRKYSNYGSATLDPVQVADVTLFLQRGARKVREFRYVGDIDVSAYAAPDMTILAEHLSEGGITRFAYQQEPDSIIWAVRADGTLLGLTYRREENVVAWHKHVIGGAFSSGQAVVEDIASLPTDSGEDELFMIVKRTINGKTKRYIEKMKVFDFGSDTTTAFFVDSGLTYSGSEVTSLSGLQHLEGESLTVLANGAAHANKTVSDAGITLDFGATSAAVGYGYTSSMQTMRIDAGSADGTSQGKPKRIHGLTVRFHETVGAEIGNDSGETDRIPFRSSANPMDEGVPLFTGDKTIEFPGGFDDDDRVYIRQDQALPMTVLALFPRLNTFDI